MTKNVLKQMKGETMDQYITRINNLTKDEKIAIAEESFNVERRYSGYQKESSYKRKIYHK